MVKFNEEICNDLCKYREEGLTINDCADLVGIDRKTVTRWVKKGEKAKSGKYKDFFIKWRKASAKFKRVHQNYISESNSWLAHQYLLQVTDPETYVIAEKIKQEVSADVNTTLSKKETIKEVDDLAKEIQQVINNE